MWNRRQISRGRGGRIRLRLGDGEQALLESMLDDLSRRLEQPDGDELRRLFPAAHEDEANESDYQELVGDSLRRGRDSALATMRSTLGADSLTAEEADAWLRALNDIRLVLGTRIGVTEDTDYERLEPRGSQELVIYMYLTWLQVQLVDAVTP